MRRGRDAPYQESWDKVLIAATEHLLLPATESGSHHAVSSRVPGHQVLDRRRRLHAGQFVETGPRTPQGVSRPCSERRRRLGSSGCDTWFRFVGGVNEFWFDGSQAMSISTAAGDSHRASHSCDSRGGMASQQREAGPCPALAPRRHGLCLRGRAHTARAGGAEKRGSREESPVVPCPKRAICQPERSC